MENREEKTGVTRAEQVAEKLLYYIENEKLEPGDRLGTEVLLSQQMGVSRGTLREAIKILVSRNILEVRQGSGTYIAAQTGMVEDPLGLRFVQDRYKLNWDLMEFRMMIEPQIAYMAAGHITEAQLAELEQLCSLMEELDQKGQDRSGPDTRFHVCIAEASGNLIAPKLVHTLQEAVETFIHYTGREKARETVATHRDIWEALKNRDPEWAKELMSMHLMFNRQELRRVAKAQGVILQKKEK